MGVLLREGGEVGGRGDGTQVALAIHAGVEDSVGIVAVVVPLEDHLRREQPSSQRMQGNRGSLPTVLQAGAAPRLTPVAAPLPGGSRAGLSLRSNNGIPQFQITLQQDTHNCGGDGGHGGYGWA